MSLDDSYSKALLHFNGADASTTFHDESGKTWTVSGDAQLDTAQKEFGSASGIFSGGSGGSISIASDSDFSPGTGAFTIDFWFRVSSLTGNYHNALDNRLSLENAVNSFCVALTTLDGNAGYIYGLGLGATNFAQPFNLNTWYHMAVVGNGGADGERTIKIYINGQIALGCTATANYNINRDKLMIGNAYDNNGMVGWIDEFRFSKGIARWTADFTPETTEYGPSDSTSETVTLTDTIEELHLVDSTSETVTLTDEVDTLHLVDSVAETATMTDAVTRYFEATRSTSETATMTDAIEYLHLVESTSETATLTDYMVGIVNDESRRRRQKVNWL